jgi:lipoprotein-releasing system permease protein
MKFYFWLAFRMLLSKSSQLFSISGLNALVGLMLGVASLVVSMAVMSGFESTLQKSVADTTGHLQILIKNQDYLTKEVLIEKIKKVEPTFVAATRFGYLEAVIAHEGKLSGVVLQGLDPEDIHRTLGLDKRIIEGRVSLIQDSADKAAPAVIGLGLAKNLNLQVGEDFRIVLPLKNDLDPNQFRRKIGVFRVTGILDLGKYDYNQRMILTSLETTQKLAEIGDRYSGLLVKFKDIEKARTIGANLARELGPGFVIRDWHDVNENLFEAVQIERIVIFFVILVIVVAAAFNIASTLYINVVTRFSEIGLLKALGVSKKGVVQIFSWQGLMIGSLGLIGGLILGLGLCYLVGWAEGHYGLLPGSIYKIDKIDLSLRWTDALAISIATLLICFLATLAPALRGAALSPVEGLKNE